MQPRAFLWRSWVHIRPLEVPAHPAKPNKPYPGPGVGENTAPVTRVQIPLKTREKGTQGRTIANKIKLLFSHPIFTTHYLVAQFLAAHVRTDWLLDWSLAAKWYLTTDHLSSCCLIQPTEDEG